MRAMKKSKHLFIAAALVVLCSVSYGQHKKMPKLKNPSGNGFIPCGSCEQPSNISSETTISQTEKGDRLTISGTLC
jgi:hypothetical protein